MIGAKLEVARLETVNDENVREAYRLQTETNRDSFSFASPQDGEELSASFTRFPNSFGRPWEAIVVTPTAEFIGSLQKTNRQIIAVIVGLKSRTSVIMVDHNVRQSLGIRGSKASASA